MSAWSGAAGVASPCPPHTARADWGATHSTRAAVLAGLDQEQPGGGFFTQAKLGGGVANGTIPVASVDGMATRVLTAMFAAGLMDTPQPTGLPSANATSREHAALALQLAEQAAVLLQNAGGLLPLSGTETVAVVGAAANCEAPTPDFGFGWPPTVGCLNSGGGSGGVVASGVTSILAAVRCRAVASGRHAGAAPPHQVRYANGSDPAAAAAVAAGADVAIVVVGATSSEGTDRASAALPADQLAYLHAVAAKQPRTVVVVMAPGAVVMDWAARVAAVACFFLPGQAQGLAVASVLYGDTNPSGRLPVTMPAVEHQVVFTADQYPGTATPGGLETSYTERLEVGYRWFNAHNATPQFTFGHGLSYTTFAYAGAAVRVAAAAAGGGYTVAVNVTNTGARDGAEVAQCYLTFPNACGEPPLQLKGFAKHFLEVGETVTAEFALPPRALSIWSTAMHTWEEQHGEFGLALGGGLADIRLRLTLAN